MKANSSDFPPLLTIVDGRHKYYLADLQNLTATSPYYISRKSKSDNNNNNNYINNRSNNSSMNDISIEKSGKFRLRRLSSASDKWKNSKAKRVSLATRFNVKGGNDRVVHSGVDFLRERGVLDLLKLLPELIVEERRECLDTFNSLFNAFGWSRMLSKAVPLLMNWWDGQCAMTICEFD
jgi:hypothetical protein